MNISIIYILHMEILLLSSFMYEKLEHAHSYFHSGAYSGTQDRVRENALGNWVWNSNPAIYCGQILESLKPSVEKMYTHSEFWQ